ncbi:MAG: hypothetical protein BWY31_03937 [Lentisphaerae bacterium ADurb.Bin242]|nr:MAG: hypothetical protein BWY31_03937 [Lentisphaerae bacterium ADurb.Bin242]
MKKTAFCLLTVFFAFPAFADFSLVRDGVSKCAVVRPKGADPAEIFAARELSAYLKKITGAEVNVLRRPDAQLYNIYLGTADNPDFKLPDKAKALISKLQYDGFALYSDETGLYIFSKEKRGVLYGVYEILKRYGGIRWIHPGENGEYCKEKKDFSIPNLAEADNPSFKWRCFNLIAAGAMKETRLWMVRNKMTPGRSFELYLDPALDAGYECFYRLIPDELFKTNPELFGLYNGKRMPQDGMARQPCTSHPETVRIMCENLVKILTANPKIKRFIIINNDSPSWCECENCKKLDTPDEAERGQVPTRYWTLINVLVKAGKAVAPGVDFFGTAYQTYHEYPGGVTPTRDAVFMPAYNARCYTHSLLDETCIHNARFRESLKKFQNNGMAVMTYNYYNFLPCMNRYYLPVSHRIAGELKMFHKAGHIGWMDEVLPYDGDFLKGRDSKMWQYNVLDMYIRVQFLWDVDADYDKVSEEAGNIYYGKAWPAMRLFRKKLIDLYENTNAHFSMESLMWEHGKCLTEYGSKEELERLLAEAGKLAEGDAELTARIGLDKEAFEKSFAGAYKKYVAEKMPSQVAAAKRTAKDDRDNLKYADHVSGLPMKLQFLYDDGNLYACHGAAGKGAVLELIVEEKKHVIDVEKAGMTAIPLDSVVDGGVCRVAATLTKEGRKFKWNGENSLSDSANTRLVSFGNLPCVVNGDFANTGKLERIRGSLSFAGPLKIEPDPTARIGKNVLRVQGTNGLLMAGLENLYGYSQNYWKPETYKGKLAIRFYARGDASFSLRFRDSLGWQKQWFEYNAPRSVQSPEWTKIEWIFDGSVLKGSYLSFLMVCSGKADIDDFQISKVQ